MTEEEEDRKNRLRKGLIMSVVDTIARRLITEILENLARNKVFDSGRVSVKKRKDGFFRIDGKKGRWKKDDVVEFVIKNDKKYKEALVSNWIVDNREEANRMLVERLKKGRKYDTAEDFDRGIEKGRVIVEEP